ncbi:type VII toxin-antitoxin system HepT family RNase toxin [Dethiobacter alkaliphilus]|uniref:type VII toxin-antitoxin system HepT family RNase toxin n=1 Tax=Dethiobacter alkaliphilus TaxID=427926 RepID=UPI002227126B|nr:DUF86 domain-containing protein [Dethiobacter alkaliphilus]MCW3490014.1 DUF86 domain-containing protein [Dethiobacter alkaliphilus]
MFLREPKNNKDIFAVLIENGYLDGEKKENYEKIAGFRNVVVQDYVRLDPEIVFNVLQRSLPDLQAFARHIKENFLS